jgi:hypothetical protein
MVVGAAKYPERVVAGGRANGAAAPYRSCSLISKRLNDLVTEQ